MEVVNVLHSSSPAPRIGEPPEGHSKRLAHNVLWNLLGAVAPMIASVFSIPILIRALGISRFGTLTVMKPILGYASILDLGLSRALTKLIADRIARGKSGEVAEIFWTGAVLTLGCGLVFGAALAAFAPWLAHRGLNIPRDMQADAHRALYLIALGLTVTVAANAFRGTLEALGRFDLSNGVRVPTGIMLAAGPLIVLPFSHSLAAIVAVLVAVRAMAWLAQLVLCLLVVPRVRTSRPARRHLGVLASFGSWVTVSNTLGQLLFYCDRFAVARLLTMSEVAYLTTPQEISTQLLIVPNAICGVLFPLFAQDFAGHPHRSIDKIKQGGRSVFVLMFPISLGLALYGRLGLMFWLGGEFARRSTNVVCWCAIALLFSATALVPYSAIQGAHRPDIPSKVYLVEGSLYILVLWWLVKLFGIEGAALSFALRTVAESSIFWVAAGRLVPPTAKLVQYYLKLLGVPTIILLAGSFAPLGSIGKATLFVLGFGNWLLVLHQSGILSRVQTRLCAQRSDLIAAE